ncbi:MAG TPA: VOC family protein [Mycobacteriales bacterium]|nr:VOC family protein [Mycobacteriales bacterium]
MLKIGSIVWNVSDNARAAEFWTRALGYEQDDNPDFLFDRSGGGVRLHLDRTDRTHLDLWAGSAQEREAEADRLVSLGATRVDWNYPEGADFVVLADTEGNLFCVIGG